MSGDDSITLAELAQQRVLLTMACTQCDRVDYYNLKILVRRHGPNFPIPTLLRLLSKDCPKRRAISAFDLCGAHCPELSKL